MSILNGRIELLSPARDLDCGSAALDCGADAVYVAGPRFGAREAAGNSMADVAALAARAHRYWARAYLALNTILRDDEVPDAVDLVRRAHDVGIDGVIVQDVGLLEQDLPPIPLIASTQMDNVRPERVAFLEAVGFSRAILGRELDLGGIRAVRAATRLELEAFVFGALCVSRSGLCHLSAALGGRSANRGQCAQPCRRPYTLRDGRGRVLARDRHLLSLKDLDRTAFFGDLLDAGVSSFKIEGRLKDRAYVSNVTAWCRAPLDEALERRGLRRSSCGRSELPFRPDPARTFSRGFTSFFLDPIEGPPGSPDTPKATGAEAARVAGSSGGTLLLDRDADLSPGDGVAFLDGAGRLVGSTVARVDGRRITLERSLDVPAGTALRVNRDVSFLRQARRGARRRIDVRLRLEGSTDGLTLTVVDEEGVSATATLEGPLEAASDPAVAAATARRQLARTGGAGLRAVDVQVAAAPTPFAPMAVLNDLRRRATEALEGAREAARPRASGGALRNEVPFPSRTLDFSANVLNRWAEAFYRRHGVTEIEPAAESGLDLRGRRVMATRYCVRRQLGTCRDDGTAMPLFLKGPDGERLELRFDCRSCGMEVFLAGRGGGAADKTRSRPRSRGRRPHGDGRPETP